MAAAIHALSDCGTTLNQTLFTILNAGAPASALGLDIGYLAAVFLIFSLPAKLIVDWLWGGPHERAAAMAVSIAVLLALGISLMISTQVPIPRPHEAGIGHSYLAHVADTSFPSDHATVLFAAAWAYAFAGRTASAWLFGAIGLMVGWARIYLGVHYPFDILGGALSGLGGAVLSRGLMALAGIRVLALAENLYRRLFGMLIRLGWVRA